MFLNAQDGKVPGFFREISGSREMPFGNSDLYQKLVPHTTLKQLFYGGMRYKVRLKGCLYLVLATHVHFSWSFHVHNSKRKLHQTWLVDLKYWTHSFLSMNLSFALSTPSSQLCHEAWSVMLSAMFLNNSIKVLGSSHHLAPQFSDWLKIIS